MSSSLLFLVIVASGTILTSGTIVSETIAAVSSTLEETTAATQPIETTSQPATTHPLCDAGYYLTHAFECKACPVGSYSSQPNTLQCTYCRSGVSTARPGSFLGSYCNVTLPAANSIQVQILIDSEDNVLREGFSRLLVADISTSVGVGTNRFKLEAVSIGFVMILRIFSEPLSDVLPEANDVAIDLERQIRNPSSVLQKSTFGSMISGIRFFFDAVEEGEVVWHNEPAQSDIDLQERRSFFEDLEDDPMGAILAGSALILFICSLTAVFFSWRRLRAKTGDGETTASVKQSYLQFEDEDEAVPTVSVQDLERHASADVADGDNDDTTDILQLGNYAQQRMMSLWEASGELVDSSEKDDVKIYKLRASNTFKGQGKNELRDIVAGGVNMDGKNVWEYVSSLSNWSQFEPSLVNSTLVQKISDDTCVMGLTFKSKSDPKSRGRGPKTDLLWDACVVMKTTTDTLSGLYFTTIHSVNHSEFPATARAIRAQINNSGWIIQPVKPGRSNVTFVSSIDFGKSVAGDRAAAIASSQAASVRILAVAASKVADFLLDL